MGRIRLLKLGVLCVIVVISCSTSAQSNVAREWYDILQEAIDDDFSQQGVQARNSFHLSICMYDVWAVFDDEHSPYLLGSQIGDFESPFLGYQVPVDSTEKAEALGMALSYASNHMIRSRYQNSPGFAVTNFRCAMLMDELGYDDEFESVNYLNDGPAALGLYVAEQVVEYGLQDGSNQQNDYESEDYLSLNAPLITHEWGNPTLVVSDHWQTLEIIEFIDSGGNPLNTYPQNETPEWGNVQSYALDDQDYYWSWVNGETGYLWFGAPAVPAFDDWGPYNLESDYKWSFTKVVEWSSDLKHEDEVFIDISPSSLGQMALPENENSAIRDFFDQEDIWSSATGIEFNPVTGEPFEANEVPVGDFTRSLVTYWTGLENETQVDNWIRIWQEITDHPMLEKRWQGQGPILSDLEWEIRTGFALTAAIHDAAIVSMGNKGTIDFVRPISALRWMAENGQSSFVEGDNYDEEGIPLIPGLIEQIEAGDPLEGEDGEHIGEIKFYSWLGPDEINNPSLDAAGVGWNLGGYWWPWQRPTHPTPASGGSPSDYATIAFAATGMFEYLTGSEYFPGGTYEHLCEENAFLVYEQGPSQDVLLQWATYNDAAISCALSRLWAGTDIPQSIIYGAELGNIVTEANTSQQDVIATQLVPQLVTVEISESVLNDQSAIDGFEITCSFSIEMDQNVIPTLVLDTVEAAAGITLLDGIWADDSTALFSYSLNDNNQEFDNLWISIHGGISTEGVPHEAVFVPGFFSIDTKNPLVEIITLNTNLLNENSLGYSTYKVDADFNEPLIQDSLPMLILPTELNQALVLNPDSSGWIDNFSYLFAYDLNDTDLEVFDFEPVSVAVYDLASNLNVEPAIWPSTTLDTKAPLVVDLSSNIYTITPEDAADEGLNLITFFDEPLVEDSIPTVHFPYSEPADDYLVISEDPGGWLNPFTFQSNHDILVSEEEMIDIHVIIEDFMDLQGNYGDPIFLNSVLDYVIPTGINEANNGGLIVYPNPATDWINIQSPGKLESIRLFDSPGRIILEILSTDFSNRIDLSHLAPGTYILEASIDGVVSLTHVAMVR